jgi:hypothetical protein
MFNMTITRIGTRSTAPGIIAEIVAKIAIAILVVIISGSVCVRSQVPVRIFHVFPGDLGAIFKRDITVGDRIHGEGGGGYDL